MGVQEVDKMQKQGEQGLGPKAPYAIGGDRDVRVRAVAAVAGIEQVVQEVEGQLRTVKAIGKLRLHYDQREQRFQWRLWEGPKRTRGIGTRLSDEHWRTLRESTRKKVQAVQRLLDARHAGRNVLRLVEWAMMAGAEWAEQTVTLRWQCGDRRRAMWGFLLSGGVIRRGGVVPLDGVESGYTEAIQRLNVRCPLGWRGEVTSGVEHVVAELGNIDEGLGKAKEALHRWLRLYYDVGRDTWQLRQMWGPQQSRYVSQQRLTTLTGVLEKEKRVLEQVVAAMERRRRVKRVLNVLMTLGDAAKEWPAGEWQIRGEQGGQKTAAWVATATQRGVSVIDAGVTIGSGWKGRKQREKEDDECGVVS